MIYNYKVELKFLNFYTHITVITIIFAEDLTLNVSPEHRLGSRVVTEVCVENWKCGDG